MQCPTQSTDIEVMPSEPTQNGSWQVALDAVIPTICAMKVICTRAYQDDIAGAHGGTAFVVDAKRGILLTNRHVCTCGPVRASATFVGSSSMEELPVKIAYVDPTHDFAFLRFDPSQLQQTPHAELTLDPSGCKIGEEIRIVGNDSLEKLQILAGTVARVDRNVPDLSGDFQDENTFYVLAGAGSRGGSSGSPVINRHGKCVALNAAAKEGTMHALLLPLHRIARVLVAVQQETFLPRGTVCASFTYTPFPECIRLGVEDSFVQNSVLGAELRAGGTFSKSSPPGGMLKVLRCVAGSAAAEKLKPGDVLLELEGKPCVDFVEFEDVLDDRVGKSVKLLLCRGEKRLDVELKVQDLHALIPHAFIELGLGVFHEVSYQTSQKWNIPIEGIYVAQAGFVFGESVQSESIILQVNNVPVKNLQHFGEALAQVLEKEHFSVTYMCHNNPKDRRQHQVYVKMVRQWCAFRFWNQDLITRTWTPHCITSMSPPKDKDMDEEVSSGGSTTATSQGSGEDAAGPPPAKRSRRSSLSGPLALLKKSLCSISFRSAIQFDTAIVEEDGENDETISNTGTGLVIDANAGFVLTDRTTVPQPLGDIDVTLGDVTRGASVWFVHPLHSFVILRLDPEPGSPKFGESASFEEDHNFEIGEEVDFIGYDSAGQHFQARVKVQSVRLGNFFSVQTKGWRERNLEAVFLTDELEKATGGVLCHPSGQVLAIYTVFKFGQDGQQQRVGYCLPSYLLMPMLKHIEGLDGKCSPAPRVPSLEVEFQHADLQRLRRLPARIRPPADWLKKLAEVGDTAVKVAAITTNSPCEGLIKDADLLVGIEDEVVGSVRDVEESLNKIYALMPKGGGENGPLAVRITLLRGSKERQVNVSVPLLESDGARRVLCWQGCVLQDMPRSAREAGLVPPGVYVSRQMLGSPAEADGLEGDFVVAVDGTPTPTLDSILEIERATQKNFANSSARAARHLRVETADPCGRRFVTTLDPDPLFWATFELAQDRQGIFCYSEHDGSII
jgi:S1-C subfamily serine protease